jgi:hypothetical protein
MDAGNIKTWITELNDKKSKKHDEQIRHNKAMEETAKWKAKNDELEYKFNVIKKYQEMRNLKITQQQIFRMFPEMKDIIGENNNDDDDDDDDSYM